MDVDTSSDDLDLQGLLQWLGALEDVEGELLRPGQSIQLPGFLATQLASTAGPAIPDQSIPVFIATQQQDVGTQPPGSSKARRKRPPTTQQQAAELEKQIAVQTTLLQELSINNLYLTERVRMLEMVISIRDAQAGRVQEIREGLKFNPFSAVGATTEEIIRASPCWAAAKITHLTSQTALLLAPVLPHVQRHPHLIWAGRGSDPPERTQGPADHHSQGWKSTCRAVQQAGAVHAHVTPPSHAAVLTKPLCHGTVTCGPPGVKPLPATHTHAHTHTRFSPTHPPTHTQSSPTHPSTHFPLQSDVAAGGGSPDVRPHAQPVAAHTPGEQHTDTPNARVLRDLQALVEFVEAMQVAFHYVFWLKPQLLLVSSIHAHAIDPKEHTQWEQLPSSVQAVHAEGAIAPAALPVAPESHWKGVAQSLMLSDYQKLQASVLWDLISSATASVVAHRAALGAAMAKLQQDQLLPTVTDPRASLNGAASGLAFSGAVAWKGPQTMQQEEAIMKKLQLTLVKQGCLVVLGTEALFTKILSPVQLAMLMVNSHPFLIDEMALMNAIAAECTPQVLGRLRAASTTS